MSINKAKLYTGYYSGYLLVPLYFTLSFIKCTFDAFFKALKQTVSMCREAERVFEVKKMYGDNQ